MSWRDPDELDERRQAYVDALDHRALILALASLPRDHRVVAACRLAIELGDAAADRRTALREWSHELSASGIGAELAERVPLTVRRERERALRRQGQEVA